MKQILKFSFIGLIFLGIAAISSFLIFDQPKEPVVKNTATGQLGKSVEEKERVNVLLLGTDQSDARTDTIILASFDPKSKSVDLISIPRDTYYPRPGYDQADQKKINAAYGSSGVEGTMEAASNILGGIPIHYYVKTSFDGIEKIVDSLGGVEVNVPMDINGHIKKGTQVLDGKGSLEFLRFRKGYARADLARIEAQQEFLKSALKKALGLRLPIVAGTAIKYVETDMPLTKILSLGKDASGMNMDNVNSHSLPGNTFTDKLSYFRYDQNATETLMNEIYNK